MSLLAGFDFVAEISRETVFKLIKGNLQIGGIPVAPPFEVTLPFSAGPASGTAHLVVTDLDLDLVADSTVHLVLGFDTTSVIITSPLALTVYPLDGNITIDVALQLVPEGGAQQLSVDLANASCAINFSAAAKTAIANALAGKPVTPAAFNTAANQAVAQFIHSVMPPKLPLAFTVVAGKDGTLQPSLVFEQLEVHCIPNASKSKQALGLFGIFLKANHGHGNHAQKTSTAISAAHDGVCVSISPQAFHGLAFCPGIASALKKKVADLPTTCGSSSGLDVQGITLTSIVDAFANGHIDLTGTATKSGFCYTASASFHATVTLALSGSTLTPNIALDQPDISVDIPWYCYLSGAALGPFSLTLGTTIQLIAPAILEPLAQFLLSQQLGSIPGIGLGGFGFFSPSAIAITTEGLTVQGTTAVAVPTSQFDKALDLAGSVTTSSTSKIDSGVFHTQVWCMPAAKDYPYDEYAQQQDGTYTLSGTLVPLPLTPVLRLAPASGPAVTLTGASGTAEIQNVDCYFPMPLATGGTTVTQAIHVDYTISGTTVHLKNRAAEGNYAFLLYAQAKDANGKPVTDGNGNLETFVWVEFEGHHLDIGGGYASDVQTCGGLLQQWVERISSEYAAYQKVPPWVEINYPSPEELGVYFSKVAALGIPQVDDVIRTLKIAHGNSFNRAVLSPTATSIGFQPAKLGRKVGEVVGKT